MVTFFTKQHKWYLVPIFQVLFMFSIFSQEINVTGAIKSSEDGSPLVGASVVVKGTSTGTVTDVDGNFAIKAASNGTLVISSIGFSSQDVSIENRSVIDVILQTDAQILGETVVIGYATVSKKDLVSSVGVAKSKDFGQVSATDAAQLIQGKLAGVQVINSNGLPGQGVNIFIRGTGSFTSTSPLYIIDGIQGDINSVPWQDIDDITILKDASSTAIYGSRAANGVVMVRTKRAKSGTPRITYNYQYGVSKETNRFKLLGAKDYVDLVKEMVGGPIPTSSIVGTPASLVDKTDWQDIFFQPAPQSTHYFNISGGTEKVLYNASVGYDNQDGIFRPYNYQKTRVRLSLEENIGRFKLGQTINSQYYVYSGSTYDLDQAIRMPPYASIEDANVEGGYYNTTPTVDLQDAQNPAAWINNRDSKSRGLAITSQFFGEFKLTDWLKFRSQLQIGFDANSSWGYRKAFRSGNLFYAREANQTNNFNISPFWENFASFDRTFGNHKLSGVVGITYEDGGRYQGLGATGNNFPNDELQNVVVAPKTSVTNASYYANNTNVRYSYFGRLQYDMMGKYLLSASWRRDYSPSFGPNNRSGDFPSVGVAWRLNEEDFIKNMPAISDLKLRASWGKTGNDNIGLFRTQVNVFKGYAPASPGYSTGSGKDFQQGATLSDIANPDLKWEETTQIDVGFDLGLFNNKLTFTADYYKRNNDGLLINILLPKSTGLGNAYANAQIPLNAASAVNTGIELAATYRDRRGDFRYGFNINFSNNKNEVLSLGTNTATPIRGLGFNDVASMTKTDTGSTIGSFFGFRKDRVISTQAEVDKLNETAKGKGFETYQDGMKAGDILFKDLNGDGQVNEKDQEYLGSPLPRNQYGGNLEFGYKNFDLMVGLTGVSGVEIVNSTIYYLEGTNKVFNHGVGVLDRWKKEGDVAKNPKAGQAVTGSGNLRPSDRFVEDGSYLRVRNITLSYNLPKFSGPVGKVLQSARVYFTLQNFLTFTKYSGLDPEILGYDPLFGRGIDNYSPPTAKTWLVGINVGF
jgi:TonB-dependent starch-binding outer membrane protein SusC